MSFTNDLLAGLAVLLADEAGATWRPTGVYPAGSAWPIFLTVVPAAPDEMIALTAYPVEDNPTVSDVVVGVQLRARGSRDPRPVQDRLDAAYTVLHGRAGTVIGGITVPLIWRQSGAYLGTDGNGRHEHSHNYYLHANRPSVHRPD